jgi:hypothetical protein
VTYVVRRADPDSSVTCIVRARDREGREVGRTTVDVPAGRASTVITSTIETTARANLGEVQECSTR